MDSENEDLHQLEAELRAARSEFSENFRQMTSLDMMIPTGTRKRYIFQVEIASLSWIVQLLNLACFVAGIVFIFLGGIIATAGVALVVGALFSEGAFAGQWWTITAQNNYMVYYRLWGDEKFAHLDSLKNRIADLSEKLDRLSADNLHPGPSTAQENHEEAAGQDSGQPMPLRAASPRCFGP
jgi:hypothetical protein